MGVRLESDGSAFDVRLGPKPEAHDQWRGRIVRVGYVALFGALAYSLELSGGHSMLLRVATIIGVMSAFGFAHAGPLFDAAGRGDVSVVESLLKQGVPVDERGRNEETPLIAAALADEAVVAKALIESGADIMARNKGGLTALHAAAYSGSVEVARFLLDRGADLEDGENFSGTTPLIVAAEEGRVEVAKLLISRGADISIADRDGFTALTQAWAKQRIEMVRLLKRYGATCQPVAFLGSDEYYRSCMEAGQ
jgi:ankyrin repeat protein